MSYSATGNMGDQDCNTHEQGDISGLLLVSRDATSNLTQPSDANLFQGSAGVTENPETKLLYPEAFIATDPAHSLSNDPRMNPSISSLSSANISSGYVVAAASIEAPTFWHHSIENLLSSSSFSNTVCGNVFDPPACINAASAPIHGGPLAPSLFCQVSTSNVNLDRSSCDPLETVQDPQSVSFTMRNQSPTTLVGVTEQEGSHPSLYPTMFQSTGRPIYSLHNDLPSFSNSGFSGTDSICVPAISSLSTLTGIHSDSKFNTRTDTVQSPKRRGNFKSSGLPRKLRLDKQKACIDRAAKLNSPVKLVSTEARKGEYKSEDGLCFPRTRAEDIGHLSEEVSRNTSELHNAINDSSITSSFISAMTNIVNNLSAASCISAPTTISSMEANLPSDIANLFPLHNLPNLNFPINPNLNAQMEQIFLERFPWVLEQMSQSAIENGCHYGFGAALPFLPSSMAGLLNAPAGSQIIKPCDPNTRWKSENPNITQHGSSQEIIKNDTHLKTEFDELALSDRDSLASFVHRGPPASTSCPDPNDPKVYAVQGEDVVLPSTDCCKSRFDSVITKTRGSRSVEAVVEKLIMNRDRSLDDQGILITKEQPATQLLASTPEHEFVSAIEDRKVSRGDGKRKTNRRCSLNNARTNECDLGSVEFDDCLTPIVFGCSVEETEPGDTASTLVNATKRRRKPDEPEESLIRYPLTVGWTRKTHVRLVTKSGVRGDVVYYSPDGRKLKSFQEIDRFLLRCEPSELTRQHFTFSSKLLVGTFVQHFRDEHGNIVSNNITEDDIINQIRQLNPEFQKIYQPPAIMITEPRSLTDESRCNSLSGVDAQLNSVSNVPILSTNQNELLALKDVYPHDSSQEMGPVRRTVSDILRECEIRNKEHSAIGPKRAITCGESITSADITLNTKREQTKRVKQNVRRIFQGVGLLKQRQQRIIDTALECEMKNCVEDLLQRDLKPLPDLQLLPGLTISPTAFVDCLVVLEFFHTFARTLHINPRGIPKFECLQQSLQCVEVPDRNKANSCAFYRLLRLLLHNNFVDGTVQGKRTFLVAGQKFTDASLNVSRISEPLNLFLFERNAPKTILDYVSNGSIFELDADVKARLLAFLCNELISSKQIIDCVDDNLAKIASLRRQKWEIEGRIRKLRLEMGKAELHYLNQEDCDLMSKANATNGRNSCSADTHDSGLEDHETDDASSAKNTAPPPLLVDENSLDGNADRADVENCVREGSGIVSTKKKGNAEKGPDDKTASPPKIAEEHILTRDGRPEVITSLERQISGLQRECERVKEQIIKLSASMRSPQLGRDRYKRRYWFFARLGALYIEGADSTDQLRDWDDIFAVNPTDILEQSTDHRSEKSALSESGSDPLTIEKDEDHFRVVKSNALWSNLREFHFNSRNKECESDKNATCPLSDEPVNLVMPRSFRTWISTLPTCIATVLNSKMARDQQFRQIDWTTIVESDNDSVEFKKFYHYAFADMTCNEREARSAAKKKLQFDEPEPIPNKYRSMWWHIKDMDTLRRLLSSLSKRGIRERGLYGALSRKVDQIELAFRNESESDDKLAIPIVDSDSELVDDQLMDSVVDVPKIDFPSEKSTKEPKARSPGPNCDHNHVAFTALLENIYAFEDKIVGSSLQVLGQSFDPCVVTSKSLSYTEGMRLAINRVLSLEPMIERRYMKEPFVAQGVDEGRLTNITLDKNQQPTKELLKWRKAVMECPDIPSLSKLMTDLDGQICWDKSIMRVTCQICNRDEHEDQLLLCDACDRGHHTYCFLPEITDIPDGDWFCIHCLAKSKGQRRCFICAGSVPTNPDRLTDVLYDCQHCGKHFHLACHRDAVVRDGTCLCLVCHATTIMSSKWTQQGRKRPFVDGDEPSTHSGKHELPCQADAVSHFVEKGIREEGTKSPDMKKPLLDIQSLFNKPKDKTPKNTHNLEDVENDERALEAKKMRLCSQSPNLGFGSKSFFRKCKDLTNELINHQVSWPFREAVDEKIYPEYYEIIEKPIDLQVISNKALHHQYSALDEFISDVRLIFSNCHFYNEDDSPVGKAGAEMSKFFEQRLQELFPYETSSDPS